MNRTFGRPAHTDGLRASDKINLLSRNIKYKTSISAAGHPSCSYNSIYDIYLKKRKAFFLTKTKKKSLRMGLPVAVDQAAIAGRRLPDGIISIKMLWLQHEGVYVDTIRSSRPLFRVSQRYVLDRDRYRDRRHVLITAFRIDPEDFCSQSPQQYPLSNGCQVTK